jgi:hypothetical protein
MIKKTCITHHSSLFASLARTSSTSFVPASFLNNDTPIRNLLADSNKEARVRGWTPVADLTLTSGKISGLQCKQPGCTTAPEPGPEPGPEPTSQSQDQLSSLHLEEAQESVASGTPPVEVTSHSAQVSN